VDVLTVLDIQGRAVRKPFDFRYVRRDAESLLEAHLRRKEVTLILGPRQCGKTCLLRRLISTTERPEGSRVLYLNLDSLDLRLGFASPMELARFLEARGYAKGDLVMLDEVQRLDDPGLYVKQLQDLDTGIKLIVSGSASTEIRARTREHLTGRRRIVELAPLSLSELVLHRGSGWTSGEAVDALSAGTARGIFHEMAVFGGYPAVWNESDPYERVAVIAGLYDTYIKRDVTDFLGIRNVTGFNDVVTALAGQVGSSVTWSEVAGLVGVDVRSVRSYVDALEATYVLRRLRPMSGRGRNEIGKSPKCMFVDNGLLNAGGRGFAEFRQRADRGALTENLALSEILKRQPMEARYWRTTSGAEVDLILVVGGTRVPIEVKSGALSRPTVPRGLRSFIERYAPPAAFVLHSGTEMEARVQNTTVRFLPVWSALLDRPWLPATGNATS